MLLPGGFLDAHDFSLAGQFPEANTAQLEFPHVTALAAAEGTAVIYLGRLVRFFSFREGLQVVCLPSCRFNF